MFNKKGFSLVELMIVVAIIGILAAIAIPNYIAMQLKAKRSELPGNVDGIKTSELSYDAAFDAYVACDPYPAGAVSKVQNDWDAASSGGFQTIGWRPDGKVRGQYSVDAGDTDFTVNAIADVDADGQNSSYTATTSINATLTNATNDVY